VKLDDSVHLVHNSSLWPGRSHERADTVSRATQERQKSKTPLGQIKNARNLLIVAQALKFELLIVNG
jgi:hypothetical protein